MSHPQPLTEKADVYSMGMIFFAIIAGRPPYNGDKELLDSAMARKARPDIDSAWHEGFMEVQYVFHAKQVWALVHDWDLLKRHFTHESS